MERWFPSRLVYLIAVHQVIQIMLTKNELMEALRNVPDPEMGISIVDLGLIYDIKYDKKGNVDVVMTLTTMGCPLFELIAEPMEIELKKIEEVKKVNIELTFDPPWTPEKMTEEGKIALGFF